MDERRLRDELRTIDRAVRPDDEFAAQLLSRLLVEARLWPAAAVPGARRSLLRRRWLGGLAMALLATGLVAGAILSQRQNEPLACEPALIEHARAAAGAAPSYRYVVVAQVVVPGLPPRQGTIRIDGAYASPGHVHEVFTTDVPLLVSETLRDGNQVWHKQLSWAGGWIVGRPYREDVTLPHVDAIPAGPALFALDGLLDRAPGFEWLAAPVGEGACRLSGRYVWSTRNDARQLLEVDVQLASGLPVSVRNRLEGFVNAGQDLDWDVRHEFDYSAEAATIPAPGPGELAATIDPNLLSFTPRRVIREGESAVVDGVRVTVLEVGEAADYEGSTPMPGNVYVQVKLRYEGVEGSRPVLGAGDWTATHERCLLCHLARRSIADGPQPILPSHVNFGAGMVMEGWWVAEVPANGRVAVLGGRPVSNALLEAPLEIVVRDE